MIIIILVITVIIITNSRKDLQRLGPGPGPGHPGPNLGRRRAPGGPSEGFFSGDFRRGLIGLTYRV